MEQLVIKTEMQPNGDILLYYVDENNEEIDSAVLEQDDLQMQPETKYIIEDNGEGESADELDIAQATEQVSKEIWSDDDISRLLIFYIDNKKTFLDGATKKKHLWAVACRTMLTGKNPLSCEIKLRMLRKEYTEFCLEKLKGGSIQWPYFNICYQAFHDDSIINAAVSENANDNLIYDVPVTQIVNEDGILVSKTPNVGHVDEDVENMLKMYIKHKDMFPKINLTKSIWETIALEIGHESADYWHKRFLNFKQHYVRLLYKRNENGPENTNWRYKKYFDQIFGDDMEFQQKYFPQLINNVDCQVHIKTETNVWSNTEKTFLVKYYFDSFNEFQDPSIPDNFLWHDVGRLLNKDPESCHIKYEELKEGHFNLLKSGSYDLPNRMPLAILFDSIIAREAEIEISKTIRSADVNDRWKTEQIDELVQYLYDNVHMFKDSVCYYVCWAIIAKQIHKSIKACRKQWNDLTSLYKSILEDKKENPDKQIDWRYIDLFDRIFDYGMDTNLLNGYEKLKQMSQLKGSEKVVAKKLTIKDIDEQFKENGSDDEESYDERGFMKRTKKGYGDKKAFHILDYYLKHKDKFASSHHKKLSLWEVPAKQIGITPSECAHRFRNFKQVYTSYVQREITKPEMPILWPYYGLCKKVFGYRAIKSKLKNGKMDSDDAEDWTARDIKKLIKYFAKNSQELIEDPEETSKWADLAKELGKTEISCCEKFMELRKSYRKLKTMKSRNPDVKVSWKYFNMIDDVYNNTTQNTEVLENMHVDENSFNYDVDQKIEPQDEDYQCIIVMPEGEDDIFYQNNYSEAIEEEVKEILEVPFQQTRRMFTWNKRSKKRLLILCLKYLRTHENIIPSEMWTEIASNMDDKTAKACRNMYLKLKNNHKLANEEKTPYSLLLDKILAIKRKKCILQENKSFKDVIISDEKVIKALEYYLENLEDFISPKFEKKVLWGELAKHVTEPVVKVFNKINYLKQNFDDALDSPINDLLRDIFAKENSLQSIANTSDNSITEDENVTWSDVETERLLTWYLAHLDKFKNPKFIRSYLWMEASDILKKSPLACSKKMLEIRSEYRKMVKENLEDLEKWRFNNLCQRIYGTGKK